MRRKTFTLARRHPLLQIMPTNYLRFVFADDFFADEALYMRTNVKNNTNFVFLARKLQVGGPIQPGSGGVSPQPTWSQHAIDQYAYDVMYMQQIQHATYQNWQMPVPPPDSQYGYFGPCFGPPFPHPPAKNYVMYHPGQHTASNMGPHQYPN